MNFCGSIISTGSSRFHCKDCGYYFKQEDGIAVLAICFGCIKFYEYPDPVSISAYHSPKPPEPDPYLVEVERQLTRATLALYFMHEAMLGTAQSLNPTRSAQSAAHLFAKNFPEFCGPY
jgi:rubredoxin